MNPVMGVRKLLHKEGWGPTQWGSEGVCLTVDILVYDGETTMPGDSWGDIFV